MSDALEAAKLKAEKTYNAAVDKFDAEPLAFWDRYGRRTVERLKLRSGVTSWTCVAERAHLQCPLRKAWVQTGQSLRWISPRSY